MLGKFAGDGRYRIHPDGLPVSRAQAQRIIRAFLTNGYSHHASAAGVSWVIIEYCRLAGIEIRIEDPAEGGRVIYRGAS